MTTVREIVMAMGGVTQAAVALGFEKRKGASRISNWIRRDCIPASVRVNHYHLFKGIENALEIRSVKKV